MNKFSQLIAQNPLFDKIPEENLASVIRCMNGTLKHFEDRTLLFQPDRPVGSMGIVLKGCVESLMPGADGSWLLITQAGPGELFAHALTVSGITDHPFEIYALADSDVLFLNVPEFTAPDNSGCSCRFQVMENLMVLIARRNTALLMKLQILAQKSLRQKLLLYFSLLSREQHSRTVTIPFGRDKLSCYLSCDRSALSRELGRMQKERLITCTKNMVTILK